MKRIPLTQGLFAKVDDADYEWLMQWKWHAEDRGKQGVRAARGPKKSEGRGMRPVLMHRQITGAAPRQPVDHANHDQLDNQRANLRLCTNAQNMANRRKQPGCSSRFKGVHWYKRTGRWMARIEFDGRKKHLGYFDDEEEAARAYNVAAREHFKEFALLNNV